jgi:hypothetical protein
MTTLIAKNNPSLSKDLNRWVHRHNLAVTNPNNTEKPIVDFCKALKLYADNHKVRYDSNIAHDGVLGEAFLEILKNVRALLNGECGRLDCGTIDAYLISIAEKAGFDTKDI